MTDKSLKEYGQVCDGCKRRSRTDPQFAKVFPKKLRNMWMRLCSECWKKQSEQDDD